MAPIPTIVGTGPHPLDEEDAPLPLGTLLIPPVRELGGSRKRVGTYLQVAQHFDRAFGILQSLS